MRTCPLPHPSDVPPTLPVRRVAAGELAALRKDHDDFVGASKAEVQRMHDHLVSELDVLTQHKEGIEQQLAEGGGRRQHKEGIEQQLAEVRQGPTAGREDGRTGGTEGRRDGGTEGRRDGGTEGGTEVVATGGRRASPSPS
eukprot:2047267-Prymnesium_polylepis.1